MISWAQTLARGLDAANGAATPGALVRGEEIEAAIARALDAGRQAWPSLPLDAEVFVHHLGRCLASWPGGGDLLASLAECQAADLYLACAAGYGVNAAVEIVAGSILAGAAGAVRKIHPADGFLDEVMQILRHKLFVAEAGEPPKILTFSGRAPLGVWLAAVAQRAALSLRRADGAQAELGARAAEQAALAAQDPELRYVQGLYAGRFEEAFRHALGRLSERGRALLRLHTFMRMTLEQLAGVYGVDDATISRWIARARRDLLDETARYMRETFGVSPAEFPSLVRVLTSQLEVSMARLLEEPPSSRRR